MGRKVVIDCDPGIDDSLALMLALSMEELEVLGITVVCGNSPVEMGFENAKKILKHMGRLDVPVFMGAGAPMRREYVNALDTHGSDGLGESFLEPVPGYRQQEAAVDFLKRILRTGECSVIALGPLTNLAQLIMTDREAFDRIRELVSMGGNFRSHGNCSPVAEYNYWADPDAAALVYQTVEENAEAEAQSAAVSAGAGADAAARAAAKTGEAVSAGAGAGAAVGAAAKAGVAVSAGAGAGAAVGAAAKTGAAVSDGAGAAVGKAAESVASQANMQETKDGSGDQGGRISDAVFPRRLSRIHMVGLDVTRKIVLTPDLLEYLNRLDSFHGDFIRRITKFYYDFHWQWEHLVGCVINDPLAVAYFADRSLCHGFEAYVDVETGGICLGQTVVDSMNFYRRQPNTVVLDETDAKAFFYKFFGKLLKKEWAELDLLETMCRM